MSSSKSNSSKSTTTKAVRSTLFIGQVPKTIDDDELENVFSEFGPIKEAFVVRDRESGLSRGIGYVKFALLEDAEKAVEDGAVVDGKKLVVSYAEAKKKDGQKSDNQDNVIVAAAAAAPVVDKQKKKQKPASQRQEAPNDDGRTVIVTIMDKVPKSKLKNKFMKVGKIQSLVLSDDNKRAEIVYDTHKLARIAIQKLNGINVGGDKKQVLMMADLKTKHNRKDGAATEGPTHDKNARIIIRNLSFKATVTDIKTHFKQFGTILDVQFPLKDGKSRGFAFVQYSTKLEAKKAVSLGNGTSVRNRQVAVDMSLAKDRFEKAVALEEEKQQQQQQDESESESESGSDNEDSSSSSDTSGSGTESTENSVQEFIDSDDESDIEGEEEVKKVAAAAPSDVQKGLTIFIRNVPFSATSQDLENCLGQFGKVEYAKIVMDHSTNKPRGTAFVKFVEYSAFNKCMIKAATVVQVGKASEGGVTLSGRSLLITKAVDKASANDIEKKKIEINNPKSVDSRNLYLSKEGHIEEGSKAAKGVSKSDMEKRKKGWELKSAKLKDPVFVISKIRLSVRNIPIHINENEVLAFCNEAGNVGKKKGNKQQQKQNSNVKNCVEKVNLFRDAEVKDANGKSKSKGYAFVNFHTHESALKALRTLNNNPKYYSQDKRLIVEFVVENQVKMQQHMKNIALQRQNNVANVGTKKRKKRTLGDRFKAKREKRRLEKLNNGDATSTTATTTTTTASDDNKQNSNSDSKNTEHKNKDKKKSKDVDTSTSKPLVSSKVINKKPTTTEGLSKKNDLNPTVIKQVKKTIDKKQKLSKNHDKKNGKKASMADLEDQHFQKLVDKYKVQLFGDKKKGKAAAVNGDDGVDNDDRKKRWFH